MQRTIRVLLVDDEYLVRDLLKVCIDWEELGFSIIGEAEDAKRAIELMNELKPDVVITDIRMPQMDGLAFSEYIQQHNPNTKVVILTGHGEFHYAKKALEAGVDYYLLKPINDEELIEILSKLKYQINKEIDTQQRLTQTLKAEREAMLLKLLLGQLNVNEVQQIEHDWFQYVPRFQVGVAELGTLTEYDRSLVRSFQRVIEDWDGVFSIIHSNNSVIVINGSEQQLSEIFIQLEQRKLWFLGVGNWKNKLQQVDESYYEALIALNYKRLDSYGIAINYKDRAKLKLMSLHSQFSLDKLDFSLQARLVQSIKEQVAARLLQVSLDELDAISMLQLEAIRLEAYILKSLSPNAEHPKSPIIHMRFIQQIIEYLDSVIEQYTSEKSVTDSKNNELISKIQSYLEQNFTNSELSLGNVAKQFYVNASYLSRTFKVSVGCSFVEYVTKLRMERAKQLLARSDLKIYEIASEIGYKDAHYFGLSFKKYFGMSVNDYRKKFDH